MKRIALPVAAIAIALASMVGCSKNDTTATTNTTAAQASSGNNSNTTKATDSKTSGTEKKASDKDNQTDATDDVSDVTVPDDVSIPTNLDKTMADAQKCLDMSMAYAGLFTPLLGGSTSAEDKAKIEAALKDMKSKVPDRIANDLTVIETGLQKANGIVELGNFLDSDEYKKANDSVTNYLTKECDKVGS